MILYNHTYSGDYKITLFLKLLGPLMISKKKTLSDHITETAQRWQLAKIVLWSMWTKKIYDYRLGGIIWTIKSPRTTVRSFQLLLAWWRHQMETFSTLLAICAGNSPGTGEFPAQRSVTRSLMFSLICVWINGWVNNGEAGDLRRYHAHYDVTVMIDLIFVDELLGTRFFKRVAVTSK